MVIYHKFDPQRQSTRYKWRLVILGNKQQFEIDYEETFARVIKLTTVRSLLVVAYIQGWHTYQMDVKNTFLYGELEETMYMKFPPDYEGSGFRFPLTPKTYANTYHSHFMVCKITKSLYGLKSAP